jgi:hypothetical protein
MFVIPITIHDVNNSQSFPSLSNISLQEVLGCVKPDVSDPLPLLVGTSEKAGRFIYVTRDVDEGEIILKELPLIKGHGKEAIEAVKSNTSLHSFYPMDPRPVLTKLSSSKSTSLDDEDAAKILKFNCFSCGKDDKGRVLYQQTSMFNHSCVPNLTYTICDQHTEGNSMIVLRALRDIKAGEELNISYCGIESLIQCKTKRAKELNLWFPSCLCTICKQPSQLSTEKRMKTYLTPLLRVEQSLSTNFYK